MLVLELLQNQAGGSDIGGSIRGIIAHFKYDAGIEIKRCLPIGHGLIVNRGEDGQISVAAGSTVGTGGNQRRVGDADAQSGRCAHSPRGRRHEEIYAGGAIQIVARLVGGVEGIGETRCQLVETATKAWNFLVANLNQAGEASAFQRTGDVLRPSHDVLHSVTAKLGGELETLRSRYQRRPI